MRFGPPGNRARIRTIKAGSVHLKIYTGTLKKRPIYTVYRRVTVSKSSRSAIKGEAQTECGLRNTEQANQGMEAIEFPSWLRIMAQKANERLVPFGKNIDDAVNFYVEHLAK